jgi:hypothetical protein
MLTVYHTDRFPGGSKFDQFEGSTADVLRHIFEDLVDAKSTTIRGTSQITLEGTVPGSVVPRIITIDGPQVEMAPLIYLMGIYFEQLAFAKDPFDDAAKLETVLTACCEIFGLDSREFVPKGWPVISQCIDDWLEEFATVQNIQEG